MHPSRRLARAAHSRRATRDRADGALHVRSPKPLRRPLVWIYTHATSGPPIVDSSSVAGQRDGWRLVRVTVRVGHAQGST